MLNIMVTTSNKGVFCCQVADNEDLSTKVLKNLKNCRMVVKWRNNEGLLGMANYGPTANCLLSPMADLITLHDVTAIFQVTDKAAGLIW